MVEQQWVPPKRGEAGHQEYVDYIKLRHDRRLQVLALKIAVIFGFAGFFLLILDNLIYRIVVLVTAAVSVGIFYKLEWDILEVIEQDVFPHPKRKLQISDWLAILLLVIFLSGEAYLANQALSLTAVPTTAEPALWFWGFSGFTANSFQMYLQNAGTAPSQYLIVSFNVPNTTILNFTNSSNLIVIHNHSNFTIKMFNVEPTSTGSLKLIANKNITNPQNISITTDMYSGRMCFSKSLCGLLTCTAGKCNLVS